MTKQEKLEDGIQHYINKFGYSLKARDLLEYLDNNDVVIKMVRDLVNTTSETETIKSKLHEAVDAHVDNKITFIELMDGIVKAGYEAVESLIKGAI